MHQSTGIVVCGPAKKAVLMGLSSERGEPKIFVSGGVRSSQNGAEKSSSVLGIVALDLLDRSV